MGVTGLEPVTSCMSSKHSSQLSYTPEEDAPGAPSGVNITQFGWPCKPRMQNARCGRAGPLAEFLKGNRANTRMGRGLIV